MLTAATEVFKAQRAFASARGIVRSCTFGFYSSALPHIAPSKTSFEEVP